MTTLVRRILDRAIQGPQPPALSPIPAPRHRSDVESITVHEFIPRHADGVDHEDTVRAATLRATLLVPVARITHPGWVVLSRAQSREQAVARREALR